MLGLSQRGASTIMLAFILVIVVLSGFVFFKLYIEPSKISPDSSPKNQEVLNKDSFSTPQTQTLANPASENCAKQGGILKIMKNGAGGEFGLCQFEDDQACEEWALMRGQCPKGGVKTIGYDNDAQAYCAWIGGETTAEENATCTLPGGKTCPVTDLWEGSCS
jgi:putative hemolysin